MSTILTIITIAIILKIITAEIKPKRKNQYPRKTKTKAPYKNIEEKLLSATEIGKHFNKSATEINKVFLELGWIRKEGKWTLATDLGFINGAEEKYNHRQKTKYVKWEEDILENTNFIDALKTKAPTKTSYQEKVIKGKEYEEYVAKVYRSRGYHVTEHGKEKGRKDHGIDLIAKKGKELVLIQCKDWNENNKYKITHEKIKAFQTDARTFVEDKPLLRGCLLTARYTISGNFIDASAIKHIEEMQKVGKRIDYEIIKVF